MWKVEIYRSRGIREYNDIEVVIWVQTLAGIVKSRDLKREGHEAERRNGYKSGDQDWGYITVRPSAHMFWWLYYVNPTNKSVDYNTFDKPLVIWLQGGPGSPSTGLGNFGEIGPFDIKDQPRNHTWVNDYNVLFIDNPVGTGFSYVDDDSAYATDNHQIAEDLVRCMHGFLAKIPEFKKVPTYIVGESYGGKMAAEFALLWYKHQQNGTIISNLKGVAFGDSWISPITIVGSWAPFLLNTGMVDTEGYEKIQSATQSFTKAVEKQEWGRADYIHRYVTMILVEVTGGINFYNILEKVDVRKSSITEDKSSLQNFMNNHVREALKLNVTWNPSNEKIVRNLHKDYMKPVTEIVTELLDKTDLKVIVYNGQLDLIVPTIGTLSWVENLEWKHIKNWKKAKRIPIINNDIIEGYFKGFQNFKMYWINRAGHYVPEENPIATHKMMNDLTSEEIA
ncbi:hypothetical protein PV328_007943 [Microctonus aethiopoides]|uniref:Carboxypeptidase n=1 Tax=Microctonus aethiopoides TaxID=144406 RepID=A0AA39F0W6_9HYME|nr:hypothetical protein PV328_007943 [Microctonus aethiopoides]